MEAKILGALQRISGGSQINPVEERHSFNSAGQIAHQANQTWLSSLVVDPFQPSSPGDPVEVDMTYLRPLSTPRESIAHIKLSSSPCHLVDQGLRASQLPFAKRFNLAFWTTEPPDLGVAHDQTAGVTHVLVYLGSSLDP